MLPSERRGSQFRNGEWSDKFFIRVRGVGGVSGRSPDQVFGVRHRGGGATNYILSRGSLSQNTAHDVFKKTGRLR